ncbi:MAG: hypothetical protein US74_C0002G0008 [Parcubacteria group bacterium GW2011_GWA2_38_13]|nr:MAG: hypothetical protein US74_C0002G0008 [Parcubacteria group bacterium GW2011_GWA2_38_13]
MRIILKLSKIITLLFLFFTPVYPVFAQGIGGAKLWDSVRGLLRPIGGAFGYQSGIPPDIRIVASMIINIMTRMLIFVFILLIFYGGYVYMMAKGEEDEVRRGKGILRTGIIGVIIIFSSLSIAKYVVGSIYCATSEYTDWCLFFMRL